MNAITLAADIVTNADDFWEGRVDYESFDLRAKALWNRADAEGIHDEISAILLNSGMRRAESDLDLCGALDADDIESCERERGHAGPHASFHADNDFRLWAIWD